jgi:hypothetical protein
MVFAPRTSPKSMEEEWALIENIMRPVSLEPPFLLAY